MAESRVRHAWLLKLVTAGLSIAFTVALFEIGLRLLTPHPVSRTSNLLPDPVLGYRMDPRLPDIDDAGFRYPAVLDRAELVVLGDSHAYGFEAESDESWPRVLAAELGVSVYNFGVGGFGVLQLRALLERALALEPKWLVIGLYLPNDLDDVTKCITELDLGCEWANEHGFQTKGPVKSSSLVLRARLAEHVAILSAVRQLLDTHRPQAPQPGGSGFHIDHPRNPTYFSVPYVGVVAGRMNLERPEIRAALDLLEEFFRDAKRMSDASGTRLTVVRVPSKHFVYWEHVSQTRQQVPSDYAVLVAHERALDAEVSRILGRLDIPTVAVAPYLARALSEEDGVFSPGGSDHPLAAGYRAYARAARASLSGAR